MRLVLFQRKRANRQRFPSTRFPLKRVTRLLVPDSSLVLLLQAAEAVQPAQIAEPPVASQESTVATVVPQPITPPAGAKPSIHTGDHVVKATTGPSAIASQSIHHAGAAGISHEYPTTTEAIQSGRSLSRLRACRNRSESHYDRREAGQGQGPHCRRLPSQWCWDFLIIAASFFAVDAMGSKKKEEELFKLMEQAADPTTTDIMMSGENVKGLLDTAASSDYDENKLAVYQTLLLSSANDGTDIDKEIADYATSKDLNDQVRVKMFQVLGKRGSEVAVPYLLKFAQSSKEEKAVVAALNATGKSLQVRDLDVLFKMIASTKSADVRAAAERTAKRFLVGQNSNSAAAKDLLKAFRGSLEPQPRESFLRLLGATGAPEAETAIDEALSSDEKTLKISGYAALVNWKDTSMFQKQFEAASAEKEKFLRTLAFDSLIDFLAGDADFGKSRKKLWTQVSTDLRDSREKKKFISTLARGSEDWAMALVEPLTKDPNDDTSFLAEKALEAMARRK